MCGPLGLGDVVADGDFGGVGGGTRNLRAVQMLLGHVSIATAERYTAVDNSEIRAAMMAAL